MSKAEKTAFMFCSFFLIGWMAFIFFFPKEHHLLVTFAKEPHSFIENWRLTYNSFIKNFEWASKLDEVEYDRLTSTTYTMIYKREYEQLREYLSISDQMDLTELINSGVLINTFGTRDIEILRIASESMIPQKGFVISPVLSTVIGKIKDSHGHTAEIIPIWNEQFNAQVMIKDKNKETDYPDLALIENNQLVNFNPAFPYNVGDDIYISKYEPGGYTLARYEWTRIGKIAPVKQNEIVEKYGIEYDYTREDILEERYFFIVE